MINLYTNTNSASRNGISGLMSGLDTETIVKGMSGGINAKIAKQIQSKQLLAWKTEAYQSVSAKLISFSNQYLSYASTANALSKNFYNSTIIETSGENAKAVSVNGTSPSAKNLSVEKITSYAAYANFVSGKSASSSMIKTGSVNFSEEGITVNALAGETVNILYNGKQYDIKIAQNFNGTTNEEVAKAFNDALIELSDKIVMTALEDGGISISAVSDNDGGKISVIGGSGSSLAALGIKAGASTETREEPISGIINNELMSYQVNVNNMAGKTVTFDLNGIQRDVVIPTVDLTEGPEAFVSAMQKEIDKAFGSNKVRVALTEGNELTFETVKKSGENIVADTTSVLTLVRADNSLTGEKSIFQFEVGSSNRLKLDKVFLSPAQDGEYVINVNGQIVEISSDMTLSQIIDKINKSGAGVNVQYLSTTGRFSVTAKESGTSGGAFIEDVTGNLAEVLFGREGVDYIANAGSDAQIEISYDGGKTVNTVIRSSNNFYIDGLNITLNSNVPFVEGKRVTFESKSNTEDLIKNIKQIVSEYNSIAQFINKEVGTKYNRNYSPLTAEQREKMTESQIKEWEEVAKTGLLFGDGTLRSLASELRFVFSFAVPGAGNPKDIGITASNDFSDNGKVIIDEDKLRKAIEERPEDVMNMFALEKSTAVGANNYDAGIMQRIKSITDKYVSSTGATKGILIQIAGVKDSLTISQSSLYKQMAVIDKRITELQRTQRIQEDRYYKQFTALEKYIAQMNEQSGWLSQQYGSN